jgi:hypothetical protein
MIIKVEKNKKKLKMEEIEENFSKKNDPKR